MTFQEWLRVCASLNLIWPHHPIPPGTVKEWYRFVAGHEADAVQGAVDACALEGGAFPPPIGRVLQKLVELQEPDQLWGEVRAELRRNVVRLGSYRDPGAADWTTADVRELVEQIGWFELCTTPDSPNFEAQCREKWLAIRARRRAGEVWSGLPDPPLSRGGAAAEAALVPGGSVLPLPAGPPGSPGGG